MMMSPIIAGIEKLTQLIHDPAQLRKLEAGAKLHKRHSRITFEVLACTSAALLVRVMQGNPPGGNYLDTPRLVEIGKEMFTPFIPPGVGLTIETYPYNSR